MSDTLLAASDVFSPHLPLLPDALCLLCFQMFSSLLAGHSCPGGAWPDRSRDNREHTQPRNLRTIS